MTISLLHIVVPTILILAVLILYINASKKQVINEIEELKAQLEKLDNVPEMAAEPEVPETKVTEPEPAEQITENADQKEETMDEPVIESSETGASEYNTGKSGKIYTKEELELLIKE